MTFQPSSPTPQLDELIEEIKSLKGKLADAKALAEEKETLEKEYRASKKRFETIFNQSSLGKKIIDSDLRIIKVNQALIDNLQYSEKELLGANIIDLSHPDFKDNWEVLRDELWNNDRLSFSIDTCLIKKDKSTVWCHVTSIIFEDNGKTLGYTVIEDISERKRLEQVEKDYQEKKLVIQQEAEIVKAILNTQEKERARIAEGLHNSLGQLLFAAQIELNQIYFRNHSENDLSALKRTEELLQKSIQECRMISHQLMPAILHDFGLKAAIEGICNDMSGSVNFTCNIRLWNDKNDKYFEIIVYRLVQELILNICKHSQATYGSVSIEENEENVIITVKDNGRGFDLEGAQGRGIGLYSIRNNVTLLKGNVQIQSTLGKGTVITISLPHLNIESTFS